MTRLRKLVRTPRLFFKDMVIKRFDERDLAQVVRVHGRRLSLAASGRAQAPGEAPEAALAEALAEVPAWYDPSLPAELRKAIREGRRVVLYQSWIPQHTNALIEALDRSAVYDLVSLGLFAGEDDKLRRQEILRFAQDKPELYLRLVLHKLARVREAVAFFVLTFDWQPVMRQIAFACARLGIPTVLVPHESVFADRERYYRHAPTGIDTPASDLVLGWGALQEEIFVGRGYPRGRFLATGTPKLDALHALRGRRDAEAARLLGLSPDLPIATFATQPLDSQFDTQAARRAQNRAIEDCIAASAAIGGQLIVRLPPSRDEVLAPETLARIEASPFVVVEHAACYLLTPLQTIAASDIVVSINSTMLMEAALAGKVAVSTRYVDFEQLWANLRIPVVRDGAALAAVFREAADDPRRIVGRYNLAWAERSFAAPAFDGQAGRRIRSLFEEICLGRRRLPPPYAAAEALLDGDGGGIEGGGGGGNARHRPAAGRVALQAAAGSGVTRELVAATLGARAVLGAPSGSLEAQSADCFLLAAAGASEEEAGFARTAQEIGRPLLHVSPGFLRSPERLLSLQLDDLAPHHDASRPSRLERLLASDAPFPAAALERAEEVLATIRAARLSLGCAGPAPAGLSIGSPGRPKLLLLDQARSDPSAAGAAGEARFRQMLHQALERPGHEVIVFSPEAEATETRLAPQVRRLQRHCPGLHLLDCPVDLHALLDLVEEVHVVSSPLGFEALIAGKAVTCHGLPYYAGWGLTRDLAPCPRRRRPRALAEVFHVAWIQLSRYRHPGEARPAEIEEVLSHLGGRRGEEDPRLLPGPPEGRKEPLRLSA